MTNINCNGCQMPTFVTELWAGLCPSCAKPMKNLVLPQQAYKAGIIFYDLPDALQPENIDPLIWPAVKRINESGWVWTAESCQGHPDATEYGAWANNVRPMLRLVCHRVDTGKMLSLLLEAVKQPPDSGLDGLHFFKVELWPQPRRTPDWTEILVYISPVHTVFDRDQGIKAVERFAEMVNQ